MNFAFTVQGISWTITTDASMFSFPPRIAVATTWGSHTLIEPGIVPNAQSLGHEFYHVIHTNDILYAISWSIGRLWGNSYWKNEEIAADAYGAAHANDPDFVAAYTAIRAKYPNLPVVLITHPV